MLCILPIGLYLYQILKLSAPNHNVYITSYKHYKKQLSVWASLWFILGNV